MLEMAEKGIVESGSNTYLIALTILTSMNQEDLSQIGVKDEINTHIINQAKLSYSAGLSGMLSA